MSSSSSKTESAPTLAQQYNVKELEATYKGWLTEAEVDRNKLLTSTQSRLGASGLRPGSGLWTQNMSKIEDDYRAHLKLIEETETKQLIDAIYAEQKGLKAEANKESPAEKAQKIFNAKVDKEYAAYLASTGVRDAVSKEDYAKQFTGRDAMSWTVGKDVPGGGPGATLGGPATAV